MTRTVSLTHAYPDHSMTEVWQIVTSYKALHEVMAGLASFEGAPSDGYLAKGDDLHVQVRMFEKLPPQPYRMQVVDLDPFERSFHSSESGAGVKSWQHRLQVVPMETGCEVHETIEIDAGFLTPLFVFWARYMYKARHPKRLALLKK